MSENSQLPVVFSDAQRDIVLMQTPPGEIKSRPGRGGQQLSYVEIGYVVETLNRAFGFDWDFEVVQHTFLENANEVCVLGRLTVRAGNHVIVKQQFGGSDVKTLKNSGKPISLSDDFKVAASDALKKCASLLGVAHDVYRGEAATPGGNGSKHWIDDATTRRRLWSWCKTDLGLTEHAVHDILGVKHIAEYAGSKLDAKHAIEAALDSLDFDADAGGAAGAAEMEF